MFARRRGIAGRKRAAPVVARKKKQESKPAWTANPELYGASPFGTNSERSFVPAKGEATETVDAVVSIEPAPLAPAHHEDASGPAAMDGVEEVDYDSDEEPLLMLSKEAAVPALAPKPKLSQAASKALSHLNNFIQSLKLNKEEKKEPEPSNLFIKAMTAPNKTITTNGDIAFSKTNSPVLDLFYKGFVRGTSEENVRSLFSQAFNQDAKRAMQCLMHSRDVRSGKGERNVTLHALMWLRTHKPLTYIRNLRCVAKSLGYYKDLTELAFRASELKLHPLGLKDYVELEILAEDLSKDFKKYREWCVDNEGPAPVEEGASAAGEETKEPGTLAKKKKGLSLSLVAKWAPSESSSRHSHLAERLAKLMFPDDLKTSGRKRYRKMLSELRKHLNVVEIKMCSNDWKGIKYESVPGRALQRSKAAFERHDPDGYASFIGEVKTGKKKVKVGGFDPVQLFQNIIQGISYGDIAAAADPEDADDFAGFPRIAHTETDELQWKELLDKLCSKAHLTRSLSMVDVSGSMSASSNTPLAAALMMGFATATASKDAFHGKVLTFSSKPEFHEITGETLKTQVRNMMSMAWEQNTNILAAFELILKTAVDHGVPPEHMPATLFVYSDMNFDVATRGSEFGRSTHQNMAKRFQDAGYEVPRVVYWNLAGNASTVPVANSQEEGVALLSGYSPQQLKMFTSTGEFNPMAILDQAIGKYVPDLDPSEI